MDKMNGAQKMSWANVELKNWDGSHTLDLTRSEDLVYWARAIQISEQELAGLVDELGSNLHEIMRAVILRDIRRRNEYQER